MNGDSRRRRTTTIETGDHKDKTRVQTPPRKRSSTPLRSEQICIGTTIGSETHHHEELEHEP